MKFKGNLKELVLYVLTHRKEFKGAGEMEFDIDTESEKKHVNIDGTINGVAITTKGVMENGSINTVTAVIGRGVDIRALGMTLKENNSALLNIQATAVESGNELRLDMETNKKYILNLETEIRSKEETQAYGKCMVKRSVNTRKSEQDLAQQRGE